MPIGNPSLKYNRAKTILFINKSLTRLVQLYSFREKKLNPPLCEIKWMNCNKPHNPWPKMAIVNKPRNVQKTKMKNWKGLKIHLPLHRDSPKLEYNSGNIMVSPDPMPRLP